MKAQRKALTRLEFLVIIAIFALTALVIVGILDLYIRYSGNSTRDRSSTNLQVTASSRTPIAPGGASASYRPRVPLDTSGFGPLLSSLEPWDPRASLQTIAETWKDAGFKAISKLDVPLRAARDAGDSVKIVNYLILTAMYLDSEGEPKRAYETLEEARTLLKKSDDAMTRSSFYTVVYFQGVAAMRRGENENCLECRGESSCILPISPAAVHTIPSGSRLAIQHFTEYLRQFPGDLEVRWLLNLAHMTLGEHPGKVDPKYLISLDRCTQSEFNIGKLRDVGHLLGVNRFNQAGGSIMEDFDNDGLLDLALTSFDPTLSMAYYRNKGDGTFEDRSKEAGVTEQLGGLVCYQTDYNNDGRLDVFVPRGAWLPHAIRQSLLRNDGDGKFTDVTRDAGMLEPMNSNAACWADYDNDGWLDIFVTRYDRTMHDVVQGLLGSPHTQHSNRLFRNLKGKGFEDKTQEAGLDMVFAAMGSNYADFDNDCFLDMYLGTGEPSFATLIPNRMFKNVGGTRFSEITGTSGTGHLQKGHGVACGDWDRDGDNDVFIETGGAVNGDQFHDVLFQNPGQGNHWLTVKLIGKKTNRAAIGGRIKVITADEKPLTIHRHVSSGSSVGANPLQQTIGLAQSKQVAVLEIHWPTSGTTQVFRNVPVDQAIEVTEFADSFRPLNWKPIPQPQ
jgi:ASPIC and UnbV/FG-GAP-like repeat